jgi:hypothetical protein
MLGAGGSPQIRTVLSWLPVARSRPSGLNATEVTRRRDWSLAAGKAGIS